MLHFPLVLPIAGYNTRTQKQNRKNLNRYTFLANSIDCFVTSLCREFLHCCQFAVIRYENYSNQSLEAKSVGFVLGSFPVFSNYFIGYLELSNVPHIIFKYTKVCQAFVKFKMAVL